MKEKLERTHEAVRKVIEETVGFPGGFLVYPVLLQGSGQRSLGAAGFQEWKRPGKQPASNSGRIIKKSGL